jgi:hypothetical protein
MTQEAERDREVLLWGSMWVPSAKDARSFWARSCYNLYQTASGSHLQLAIPAHWLDAPPIRKWYPLEFMFTVLTLGRWRSE